MTLPGAQYSAIDPMAMILPDNIYYIWNLIHHPHVPSVADIEKVVQRMSAEEKAFALERAKTLSAYGNAVEAVVLGKKST